MIYPVFMVGFVIAWVSCAPKAEENSKDPIDSIAVPATPKPTAFELPTIPAALTIPKDRADFLVRHYWDHFDFLDTAYMHAPDITEQAMANYVDLFPHTEKKAVDSSIERTLDMALREPKMYRYFANLFKKYLYDPHSPLRNEEYYLPVLTHVLKSEAMDAAERIRMQFTFEMLQKNRVGEKSTDFRYTLASGETGKLFGIKSAYTILLFYNPDCPTCEEIVGFLKSSELINKLLLTDTLSILTLYPDGDLEVWKKYLPNLPDNWINAYDQQQVLEKKMEYDLKVMPTIYLLDKTKKVLLKDATVQEVEHYLWQNRVSKPVTR